jgi:hypothetical protein
MGTREPGTRNREPGNKELGTRNKRRVQRVLKGRRGRESWEADFGGRS